jgi:formiminotetrahydrofolate cyclodeaminase
MRKSGVPGLQAYLNRLASAQPTPGGGSAATIVGALGAALTAMVARLTLGNSKLHAVHADALLLVSEADALRAKFVAERPRDEEAYLSVVEAQALPRGSEAERASRTESLQAALTGAAEAPMRVAALAEELLVACERAAELRNVHLMSDVECALAFGQATLDASSANVRINHRYIKDTALLEAQREALAAIREAAQAAVARTQTIIAEV